MRLARAFRRGVEAAHVVWSCAADGASRRRLLGAYAALALRSWSPTAADARLRLGRSTVGLRFRQRDIYVIGEIVHHRVYRIRSTLPARPVIVDAGANIGLASLWLADRYPNPRLHCFEPEADSFALLQYNLRQVPDAKCTRAALGAQAGEVVLHVTENASDHSVFDTEAPAHGQVVPCIRLGDYLEENGLDTVDLLKIDVEGSELAVLEGLGDRIERVKVIVGEFHERLVDETAFYDLLRGRGFHVVARWPAHSWGGQHMFEAAR